jgi:hypothetical protein
MTHGGGGDRPRRRDINDESSKLGNDDRSEVVDLVEVVRSSCGEREELVERGKSSQRVAEQRKDEALFRTRTGDPLLTIAPKRLPWIATGCGSPRLSRFRGSAICDWLPLVAPAWLHKCSMPGRAIAYVEGAFWPGGVPHSDPSPRVLRASAP